jgi:CxxC-x17-CxxC domain-containing protein
MEKNMSDKKLICKDCGKTFNFTEKEQAFYKEKGFTNEPQRCPECRAANKQAHNKGTSSRPMYPAVCANCGKMTTVPFQPTEGKPVLCKECYQAKSRW